MEVMEIREEIESTDDHERLRSLQGNLGEKKVEMLAEMSTCYKESPLDTEKAIDLTSRLVYTNKLLKAIYDRLPSD